MARNPRATSHFYFLELPPGAQCGPQHVATTSTTTFSNVRLIFLVLPQGRDKDIPQKSQTNFLERLNDAVCCLHEEDSSVQ